MSTSRGPAAQLAAEVAAAVLADLGEPVVCRLPSGTRRTTGFLTTTTDRVPDGMGGVVPVRTSTLHVPAGALGRLAQDTRLTHAGTAYLVRSQAPSDDGALDLIEVTPEAGGW